MIAVTRPEGVRFIAVYRADDVLQASAVFRIQLAAEKGVGSTVVRVSEREVWVIADDDQAVRFIRKRGTGQ